MSTTPPPDPSQSWPQVPAPPVHAETSPAQQRLNDLRERIRGGLDDGEPAAFLLDAIRDAGTAGQSVIALLELVRQRWPDFTQAQAIDYLTTWIGNAQRVQQIFDHPQPPNSRVGWYVTFDNYIAAPPAVLARMALPVGLENLAAMLTTAAREHVRRGGRPGTLTTEHLEFSDGHVTVHDRTE